MRNDEQQPDRPDRPKRPGPAFTQTAEWRAAASDLTGGLWDSPRRREMLQRAMSLAWDDFKQTPRFERLRARLIAAARMRRDLSDQS